MLGHSQLEVIKPNGGIEFYPLDPHKSIFHFGSDPRNDLVIDRPGVKAFHAYLDYRQKPARFILLDQNQVALPAAQPMGLSTLELGGYIFIVLEEPQPAFLTAPSLSEAEVVLPGVATPVPPAPPSPPPNPYYDIALGELSPKRQSLSWSKPSARYGLWVTNRGEVSTTLRLEGADLQQACRFEYQLPGQVAALTGQVDFSLLPGEEVLIPIQVRPPAKPLAGLEPQVYPFTISVSTKGQRISRSVLGQLVSKPLLGPGMLAMLAFALVAFSIIIFRPLLEYSQQMTTVALHSKPKKEVSKPTGSIPILRPKATPAAPVDEPALTYEAMFQEIAPQYGLDWRVLEAVAYYESRMNYLALGRANDMGMMQIIPSTWNQWAPKVGVYDPYDPYSNISVGAAYLAYMRDFCTQRGYSEPHWMLVAYNWGPQRVGALFDQGGSWEQVPATQRRYALSILELATSRAASPATFEEFYPDLPVRQ